MLDEYYLNIDVDNVIEVLNEVKPPLWKPYNFASALCACTTQMHDNPYKKINSILVHRDAGMWNDFHNKETWDVDECDLRDDNGVMVTMCYNHISQAKHISYTVMAYYGARCDFEPYDPDFL